MSDRTLRPIYLDSAYDATPALRPLAPSKSRAEQGTLVMPLDWDVIDGKGERT
jgi:hypothetical protein